MPQFERQFGGLSPIVQGLLVSSILIAASIVSVASGPLSDRISRTYTISLGGCIFAIGAALACSATTLPQFFVGRCVEGIGEGFFISSITVYGGCSYFVYQMRIRHTQIVPLCNSHGDISCRK
jgi:MFS family permease